MATADSELHFVTGGHFSKVYVLQSLDQMEIKTGRLLAIDSIMPFAKRMGFGLTAYDIRSKAAFVEVMEIVLKEVTNGSGPIYPILHLEIHGAADKTGLVLPPTRDFVSWDEFAHLTRSINKACKNNMVVVMAVCHGYSSILATDIHEVVPFNVLIGPEDSVSTKYIMEQFPKFYQVLFETHDITAAMELIVDQYKIFFSEQVFYKLFLKYTRETCLGEGKQKHIEELLTKAKLMVGNKMQNEAELRKQFDARYSPNPSLFDRLKKQFLLSDVPENSGRFQTRFEEIMRLIR